MAGDEPMGLQTVYIPSELAPGLMDVDFESASLYETLEDRYGLVLDHAAQTHFAMAVSPEDAAMLGVPAGSPRWVASGSRFCAAGDLWKLHGRSCGAIGIRFN